MAYHFVYAYTEGLESQILQYAPSSVLTRTPHYDGWEGVEYLDAIVSDGEQPTIAANNPASPLISEPVSDGSGSLITRRVQSAILDRAADVIASLQAARVSTDQPTRNLAIDAASDLLGDILADTEQRLIDLGSA